MAGAAIGALARPRAADFRNRRRFIGSVSLRWPVGPAVVEGCLFFVRRIRRGRPPCDADYRDSPNGGNRCCANVGPERKRYGSSGGITSVVVGSGCGGG